MLHRLAFVFVVLFALQLPSTAHAEQLPGWEWGLGISVARLPDYPGSEHGTAYATPTRPAYRAPGGYTGWGVGSRLSWEQGEMSGGVFLHIENVAHTAFADSPLISTHRAPTVGFNVSRRFGRSRRMIGGETEIAP